jgi:predicted amidohydrolase YtcJ
MAGVSALQDTRSLAFALTHATVIDGVSTTRTNQTVLISGGRILAVGPFGDVRVPAGTREVDATGRFIIPGLWDAHVHTRYQGIDHLRLLLANGITSARDMTGGRLFERPELDAMLADIESAAIQWAGTPTGR